MTEEENYIKQKEFDKLHAERRERQLEALRKQERSGIADALHTSEDVAEEALLLGFDAATAPILPLVPLIEVAWADDKVTDAESEKVLELAEANGITSDEALDFLKLLLEKKPSDLFFERTNRVLAHLLNDDAHDSKDVIAQARAVADASGGIFGFGNRVSDIEEKVLKELADLFGLD